MTIKELIERLSEYPANMDVVVYLPEEVYDGFNYDCYCDHACNVESDPDNVAKIYPLDCVD